MLIKGCLTAYITLTITTSVVAQKTSETNDSRMNADSLPTLTVVGQKTANQRPVTTYETPISNLDFDPRIDMQSRNMAEAQGDISIRGGTFENTGIQVGSATLLDPQTGHYTTELPIAPEMIGEPKVFTGADNALRGFNSSVGTVSYSWKEITDRGSLTIGGGDNDLNFQRLHHGLTGAYGDSNDWTWGAEIEGSRSESDGTIPYGDHDFDRTSGRIQLLGPNSQTDFFAGFQKKFFGWPELYAAPYGSNETEDIKTNLYILNHEHFYGEQSHWEASAYHRLNNDHYIYDRFIPDQKYIHETKVTAFSISGLHVMGDNTAINYAIQVISDEINSTTLEEGKFTSRDYYKLSILPEYRYDLSDQKSITIKAGATLDDTNRDKYKISPIAEINWSNNDSKDSFERTYLSYAQTTQAVGYGAIGGKTTGLFASNPNLKRETSKNLELGYALQRKKWKVNGAIFHRWDQDLVDWVYQSTSPNSRSAKHLDIKTFGIEVISTREWANFELIGSYSYLHKTEDYKDPNIDGSFYALNFPENRITLGFIWNPNDLFQIRMDNEWREQRENIIREGPNQSTYSHIAASYYPSQIDDLEAFIAFDKPWDEEFQDIPGTPGRGDQFSLGATYRW